MSSIMGRRGVVGRAVVATLALMLLALVGPTHGFGAPAGHTPDEVLVRFRAGTHAFARSTLHVAAGATAIKEFSSVQDLQLITLAPGTSLARALEQYRRSPDVLYVERNHALKLQAVPNDPGFVEGLLWSLDMIPMSADVDIDAPEAWDITTGSPDVVVAVIDSGIDDTHEDLAANMFRNEADCNANGLDDDGNGHVDDCHGIAPINGDADPMDDEGHGTHVAGIIGAVGNNGIGVVGVSWRVRLMPCKMFDAAGFGTLAAALECLDYVAMMKDRGVNIVATNNSWSDPEFSASLRDAIDAQRQRGILFVAAAGNYNLMFCPDIANCRSDNDNDRKPTWPANYYLPNILAVGNTTEIGILNSGSAYGRRTVHVAAPGTNIVSTTPDNTYDMLTGTSMAAPHITGLAALLKAQNPARDWKAIKNLVMAGADGDMTPSGDHTITRQLMNARSTVTCANRTVVSRLRPVPAAVTAVVGRPMDLAALNIRCATPDGTVTVTVSPGGQTITLRDDGAGIDQDAGDGIYSAQWTPATEGAFSLAFPGADVVAVQVLAGAYAVAPVPFGGRTIAGTSLTFVPTQPAAIESPFPLRFAGGSFTTLFVDDRGAVHFDGGGFNDDLAIFNEPLPSPFRSTLIAPFWDQLYATWQNLSDVVWEVTGTAPNRELVVEWRNLGRSEQFCALYEGFVTFQVVFFENRSDLLFNYPDATFGFECADYDGGVSATVGVQVSPDVATMFSFNTPALADGMSLLWTVAEAPQPAIDVTPASRDFGTVAVGSVADATFVVQNSGTGILTGQATAVAPFSIVSGGAYTLAAGQTQVVTTRFSPTSAGTFAGNVTFTGGGGASRGVRGIGAAVAVAPDLPVALTQFRTDGTTALAAGAWTNQTSVVVTFTMTDASPVDTLTPEVEIKPIGTAFTGAGLVTGGAVASTGAPVQGTVTLTGLANGVQYHWRARTRDAAGQTSGWVSFGANAETARDVGVDTAAPTGSIVIAGGSAWTRSRSVTLALKCSDARSGCSQMQLGQDGGPLTPPEPFATTRAWTLSGADGKKTVSVQFLDSAGAVSKLYADTITLDTASPVVSAITATPNPFPLGQTTTIRFRAADALSVTCSAEIRILDAGGRLVRSFTKSAKCPAGGTVTSVAWDGRSATRTLVPPGTYTIEIVVTDTAGNVSPVGRASVVAQ